jgi:hypothetical protein
MAERRPTGAHTALPGNDIQCLSNTCPNGISHYAGCVRSSGHWVGRTHGRLDVEMKPLRQAAVPRAGNKGAPHAIIEDCRPSGCGLADPGDRCGTRVDKQNGSSPSDHERGGLMCHREATALHRAVPEVRSPAPPSLSETTHHLGIRGRTGPIAAALTSSHISTYPSPENHHEKPNHHD